MNSFESNLALYFKFVESFIAAYVYYAACVRVGIAYYAKR